MGIQKQVKIRRISSASFLLLGTVGVEGGERRLIKAPFVVYAKKVTHFTEIMID